jgi:hypothetical protein
MIFLYFELRQNKRETVGVSSAIEHVRSKGPRCPYILAEMLFKGFYKDSGRLIFESYSGPVLCYTLWSLEEFLAGICFCALRVSMTFMDSTSNLQD